MQRQRVQRPSSSKDTVNRAHRPFLALLVGLAALLVIVPTGSVAAQELPPPGPIELPCAVNASAQLLTATPVGDGSQTLVLARVLLAPGGGIGAHTHPGTLAVVVESGSFGLTLIEDGKMVITRAATADTEATEEPLVVGEETALEPGDSFIEMGMVHTATNLGDEQTTVLLAGLIESGQPLTACVDAATPAA